MRRTPPRRGMLARPGSRVTVRISESVAPVNSAAVEHTLRTLARLMVRSYQRDGDQTAIMHDSNSGSALTVVPGSRPDHDTDEAA